LIPKFLWELLEGCSSVNKKIFKLNFKKNATDVHGSDIFNKERFFGFGGGILQLTSLDVCFYFFIPIWFFGLSALDLL